MTIDEAIEHAEERACGNDQCAKDHAQLADWLRELRRARMEIDLLKTLRDGFKADARKYKAENKKLRELVRVLHIAHVGMTNRYKGSKTGLIWEYSGDIENDTRKLESECKEECHRFDAAMRELRIEVRS